jgi:hypothetical protein
MIGRGGQVGRPKNLHMGVGVAAGGKNGAGSVKKVVKPARPVVGRPVASLATPSAAPMPLQHPDVTMPNTPSSAVGGPPSLVYGTQPTTAPPVTPPKTKKTVTAGVAIPHFFQYGSGLWGFQNKTGNIAYNVGRPASNVTVGKTPTGFKAPEAPVVVPRYQDEAG